MRCLTPTAVAAAAAVWCLAMSIQPQSRQFWVTVMDNDRKPVTDLGAEDFSLKDGGARQPVIDSEPATGPMTIAIVIAGFPPATDEPLITAVNAFTDVIHGSSPSSHFMLVLDRTDDGQRVGRLVSALHLDAGTAFVGHRTIDDALNSAVDHLRSADRNDRRVIVAFLQTPTVDDVRPVGELASLLERNKTPLWTIEMPVPRAAMMATPGPSAPNQALEMAVQISGGLRWRVDTLADLDAGARGVAALIGTSQYLVTVNLPALFSGPAPIATRHDRGAVLVPMWSR